jgi:hypothetical protein
VLADVAWLDHYEDARRIARQTRRMVLARPMGQGMRFIEKREFS